MNIKLSQLWSPAWKIAETDADISAGKVSRTKAPLRVSKMGRGRYLVVDGNHRAMEAIMAGAKEYPAILDEHMPDMMRTGGAFRGVVESAANIAEYLSTRANPRVSLRHPPRLSAAARRQLHRGARVEMEHTRDPKAAQLIAAHHLAESPRYYAALARMERGLHRNPTHVVDFKLAAAMRRLRRVIADESRHAPSDDQVDAMAEQSFRFLKGSIEKRENRIIPHRDWAAMRLMAVTELIRLVETGALRHNNPGGIPSIPVAVALGMKVLKGFRPVLQTTDWTCGPACARAILASRCVNADEADLARQAGTTKRHGTTPAQMCNLLHDSGYRIVPTKRAGLAWCLRQLRQSRPVLLLWNDWAGHWVVLIGYDAKRKLLLLADPAAPAGVSVHTYRTFIANWRTRVAGRVYRRLAAAIA